MSKPHKERAWFSDAAAPSYDSWAPMGRPIDYTSARSWLRHPILTWRWSRHPQAPRNKPDSERG